MIKINLIRVLELANKKPIRYSTKEEDRYETPPTLEEFLSHQGLLHSPEERFLEFLSPP